MRSSLGLVALGLVLVLIAACATEEVHNPRLRSNEPTRDSGTTASTDKNDPSPTPPTSPTNNPPSGDDCAGRSVCDSFESYEAGSPPSGPWKALVAQGGKVEVSTTKAYRGTKSVKVTTTATQFQRAMITTSDPALFPKAANLLYGRMMVFLETPAADGVHWTMLEGNGSITGRNGVSGGYRYGGMHQGKLMANYDTAGASTDCWLHSQTVMPVGKWACFTWKLTGGTNEMQLWMDGKEITDIHLKDKGEGCIGHDLDDRWLAPSFAKMNVGWESYQPDVGHTMYLDDVAFDSAPLECPKP